jgi:sulfotransferase family protein
MRMPGQDGMLEVVKRPLRELRAAYGRFTGPLRGLPSVLIIGTQKGGTTSLFNYLAAHPDVLPPLSKEVHYFDLHYGSGENWYRGRFPYARQLRAPTLSLDASPYYMFHPLVPARAAALLPQVKIIALLRNPIDRALSHYQHEVRAGREPLSLDDALDRENERLAGEEERFQREPLYYSWNHHRYSYVSRGLYLMQLERWMQHFQRSQLLVLQSEWLFQDPSAATAEVCRFVGLRSHQLQRYETFLRGQYDRSLPGPLRTRLAEYFEPHNRRLYQWLGQEYDWA